SRRARPRPTTNFPCSRRGVSVRVGSRRRWSTTTWSRLGKQRNRRWNTSESGYLMDLSALLEIKQKELSGRKKHTLRCCMAAGCMSSNSQGVKEGLERAVTEAGLADEVEVRGVGCLKLCCQGPLVQADPAGT